MVPRVAPHLKRAYAPRAWCGRSVVASLALTLFAGGAAAALPEIRTSTQNKVPACVTPQRLMSFLKSRNPGVEARFADIANIYKRHGERWHVRWDYAFYQMAVETNFLSYKQGNGRWGDVNPHQNNFAGLGTTGGGVPGDSYPDVNTGVLAQIQHLVAYSGEHITDPVGRAHQAEAGRHHRIDGAPERPRDLQRPVAPLGGGPPLWRFHRMGRQ